MVFNETSTKVSLLLSVRQNVVKVFVCVCESAFLGKFVGWRGGSAG